MRSVRNFLQHPWSSQAVKNGPQLNYDKSFNFLLFLKVYEASNSFKVNSIAGKLRTGQSWMTSILVHKQTLLYETTAVQNQQSMEDEDAIYSSTVYQQS